MIDTNTQSTLRHRDPKEILKGLDGRKFFRPRHLKLGALTGRANMNDLMLELFDDAGNFYGCYLSDQLSSVESGKFDHAIRTTM